MGTAHKVKVLSWVHSFSRPEKLPLKIHTGQEVGGSLRWFYQANETGEYGLPLKVLSSEMDPAEIRLIR